MLSVSNTNFKQNSNQKHIINNELNSHFRPHSCSITNSLAFKGNEQLPSKLTGLVKILPDILETSAKILSASSSLCTSLSNLIRHIQSFKKGINDIKKILQIK